LEIWSESKTKALVKAMQSVNLYCQKCTTRKEEKFPGVYADIEHDYYNNGTL
jgi:hypothetical protein